MTFTFDLTTDVGKVRLLVPDRDSTDYMFSDEEITALLAIESTIKATTALCLETIASDNAMTLKVIKLLDLQTDGARTSDALLARAALLREQSENEDNVAGFDIAEMVVDDFSYRDRVWKEFQRSG